MNASPLSSPPLWSDVEDRPDPPGAPPPPPRSPREPRPPRRGRRWAALLAASVLVGGGAGAGVVAVADGGGSTASRTVIERTASASGGGLDAQALYAGTASGVVDITARGASSDGATTPFGAAPQASQTTASGTGFVVDAQGHIVTAAHVVDGASTVSVKLADGTTRAATVLGSDDATDVAVLRIDPAGLTLHPLALGSSAALDVGAPIAAIGDPFGYDRSISTGIVSGVDRTISAPNGFTVAHAIQTDAAMNPGNSGGPILDASGKVIGIADQIATGGTEQSSGVGFAVPIDLVKSALTTLKAGGKPTHPYLGVATANATTTAGATVSSLATGGPADDAGLRAGDVVTALGGRAISDSNGLVAAIAAHRPGDRVAVTVRRGAQTLRVTVRLGAQPARSASAGG